MPLYVLLGTLESYPLFFLLLGLYLSLRRRPRLAGLAAGIGFQIKLLPVLVLPVAWRALPRLRSRLSYLLTAAVAAAMIAVPVLLIKRAMLFASRPRPAGQRSGRRLLSDAQTAACRGGLGRPRRGVAARPAVRHVSPSGRPVHTKQRTTPGPPGRRPKRRGQRRPWRSARGRPVAYNEL